MYTQVTWYIPLFMLASWPIMCKQVLHSSPSEPDPTLPGRHTHSFFEIYTGTAACEQQAQIVLAV